MKKTTLALFVFLAGIANQGIGAVPFDAGMVPVELITEFSGGSGASVYRSLPDSFPVAPGLAGLPVTIVGSIDRSGRSAQVLLRSPLPADQLRSRLLAAYAADGWIEIVYEGEFALCNDSKGQLYMRMTSESNGTKLVISFAAPRLPSPGFATCAQQRQIREAQIAGASSIYPLTGAMPTLTPPANAVSDPRVGSFLSGGSTSGNGEGTRYQSTIDGRFTLADYSLNSLFSHLAQQLQQQGWTVDSDDVGSTTSASTWFKTVPYTALDGTTIDLTVTGFLKLQRKSSVSGDNYTYTLDVETFVPFPPVPIIIRPGF